MWKVYFRWIIVLELKLFHLDEVRVLNLIITSAPFCIKCKVSKKTRQYLVRIAQLATAKENHMYITSIVNSNHVNANPY